MKNGVPTTTPDRENCRPVSVAALASPKSATLIEPSAARRKLPGVVSLAAHAHPALPEHTGDLILPQGLPDPALGRPAVAHRPGTVHRGVRADGRALGELKCRRRIARFRGGRTVLRLVRRHGGRP